MPLLHVCYEMPRSPQTERVNCVAHCQKNLDIPSDAFLTCCYFTATRVGWNVRLVPDSTCHSSVSPDYLTNTFVIYPLLRRGWVWVREYRRCEFLTKSGNCMYPWTMVPITSWRTYRVYLPVHAQSIVTQIYLLLKMKQPRMNTGPYPWHVDHTPTAMAGIHSRAFSQCLWSIVSY